MPRVLRDRYEILSMIGRGGMAAVYRAHDRVLDREVAVKVMHDWFSSAADRERFLVEARTMATWDHPHLVRILDADLDTHEQSWLVMELVDGATLAHLMLGGPVDVGRAATIGAAVAAALDHVHGHGIAHRDVKPANILLTRAGVAKLADFGVARLNGADAAFAGGSQTFGTAAYLAPEQVSGGAVHGAVDVYALGLVLLEAVTGRRTYVGPPAEAALARLRHRPLIPVSLPRGWARLLNEMTDTDPGSRPSAIGVSTRLTQLATPGDRALTSSPAGAHLLRLASTSPLTPGAAGGNEPAMTA